MLRIESCVRHTTDAGREFIFWKKNKKEYAYDDGVGRQVWSGVWKRAANYEQKES